MAGFYEDQDVLNIYKQAFNIKMQMNSILDNAFADWLDLFEKSTNCSKMLVLPSILAMTAALSGPNRYYFQHFS